jgi:hypothetical protein
VSNKIYQHDETAVTWKSSGGTELFTGTSLASAAGRQGALHDFGTTARARRGVLRVRLKPSATCVVGERIEVYIKTSDGTNPDNDDGTGDIAVTAQDKLRNLLPVGVIQIDKLNTASVLVGTWELEISPQWWGPVLWNATANTLSATASDYVITWTPVPDEVQ